MAEREIIRDRKGRLLRDERRGTSSSADEAEKETSKAERERQHAPWRAMWEKETGKKYGIATASEYNAWLAKKRKEMQAKKAKGQTAKKQGKALAPKAEKE